MVKVTQFRQAALVLAIGGLLASCAATELVVPATHPGHPTALAASAASSPRRGVNDPTHRRRVHQLLAQSLDAQAASRIAMLNNGGARALAEDLNVAIGNLASARSLPNPTVRGALRFRDADKPAIDLGALISVRDLILVVARSGAAESAVDAAKLSVLGSLLDISFRTRRTFFDYQAALQSLELRRSVVAALSASLEATERLRAADATTEQALATEQAALADALLRVQQGEAVVASARERLNGLMGLWGAETEWRAEARLPALPRAELGLGDLEAEAIRHSLDLEIAKRRFTAAAKRTNASRAAAIIPELRVGVSAERREAWGIGPAVEIGVPLLYQGQGEVAVAEAEQRQQRLIFTDTAVRIRAAARSAAAALSAARERVVYSVDVLIPLKQRLLYETLLERDTQPATALDVMQAKREQIEACETYIEQLREYWVARSRVEQLLAGRLDASALDNSVRPEGR